MLGINHSSYWYCGKILNFVGFVSSSGIYYFLFFELYFERSFLNTTTQIIYTVETRDKAHAGFKCEKMRNSLQYSSMNAHGWSIIAANDTRNHYRK